MRSSLQRRGLGGHRGRDICLCERVWAFVRRELCVEHEEERSRVVLEKEPGAECVEWGWDRGVEVGVGDCVSVAPGFGVCFL